MEEANNSSSDSEGEDQEARAVEEEDFTVEIIAGQIQKMKFETIQPVSHMTITT